MDRATGVSSSASPPIMPTSELLETEEPIQEQNLLQEAIRQSRALKLMMKNISNLLLSKMDLLMVTLLDILCYWTKEEETDHVSETLASRL